MQFDFSINQHSLSFRQIVDQFLTTISPKVAIHPLRLFLVAITGIICDRELGDLVIADRLEFGIATERTMKGTSDSHVNTLVNFTATVAYGGGISPCYALVRMRRP